MSLLRLANLVFAYPQQVSLIDSCNLELRPGWTGVVGRNGAGKSTLLDLIDGSLQAVSGVVDRGQLTLARCHQRTAGREAVEDFATSWTAEALRWMSLLALEPADFWRWDELSPGMQRRWQIAAALSEDPGVLILDEPTNHLDSNGRELLIDALRRYDGIGVVVSHDRAFLDAICDHTVRVHLGTVRLYRGSYGAAREQWLSEAAEALGELEAAQSRARSLKSQLAQASNRHASATHALSTRSRMTSVRDTDARSSAAKGRAQRAESGLARQKGVARAELQRVRKELDELERPESSGSAIFVDAAPCRRDVVLHYRGPLRAGDRLLADDVELSLRRSERVWLVGPNGCGKTTLIETALASWDLDPARLLWVPQELEEPSARSRFEELAHDERSRALQIGAAICLDVESVLDGTALSPGEVRKLTIAVGLARQPWLIVLDEPTNDLDLETVERLEEALDGYRGAVLVVTHDLMFAERLRVEPRNLTCGAQN